MRGPSNGAEIFEREPRPPFEDAGQRAEQFAHAPCPNLPPVDLLAGLSHRANALRQEEIAGEIAVIRLSTAELVEPGPAN